MKRMIGSLMLMLVLVGLGTAREAQAQQAPELISFVSFYATPQWGSANDGTIASSYTVIQSLASYRVEVYQLRLWTLNSLTSFKVRQASSFSNNGDRSFWNPVPLISFGSVTGQSVVEAAALWEMMPFSTQLDLVPAAPGISTPAAQQYWMRLESSSRLMIDFRGGGQGAEVQGFARFRYVPYGRR